MIDFKHLLVPTDFGDASERALTIALGLAAKFEAKVTLLHATLLPPIHDSADAEELASPADELEGPAKKALDAALKKAKARYPKVDAVLAVGEAWGRILESAQERSADLIVMGTHGRRGISRVILGSVAEKVVRLSPIPVMTVCTEAERRAKGEALAEEAKC